MGQRQNSIGDETATGPPSRLERSSAAWTYSSEKRRSRSGRHCRFLRLHTRFAARRPCSARSPDLPNDRWSRAALVSRQVTVTTGRGELRQRKGTTADGYQDQSRKLLTEYRMKRFES